MRWERGVGEEEEEGVTSESRREKHQWRPRQYDNIGYNEAKNRRIFIYND
jgi:hypothetical protein